ADGKVYETKYTYHGDSNRVRTVSQSDGTALTIGYEAHGDDYRVKTLQDGQGNTTAYQYVSDSHTRVTLGNSQIDYYFNSNKRLAAIERVIDGQHVREEYEYNNAGQVIEIQNGLGQEKTFFYDDIGNLTTQIDADGVTITNSYNKYNQLISEQKGDNTNYFIYDNNQRLRFTLGADSSVVEYRYNALGQRVSQHVYTKALYSSTERDLTALQSYMSFEDKTQQRSDYSYDFRGQLSTVTRYNSVNSQGQGIDGNTTRYVYDAHGKLLQETTPRGVITQGTDNDFSTTYSYDGLGRLLSKTDANQAQTTYTYDDANQRIGTQYANGLWQTQVFDKAGQLVVNVEGTSLGNNIYGTERIYYNREGQAVATKDKQGAISYTLYDESGNKAATVSKTGAVTRLHYDQAGRVTQTIQYAQKVNTSQWLSSGGAMVKTLAQLDNDLKEQDNHAENRSSYTLYTSAGKIAFKIDAQGYGKEYIYNKTGRLVATKRHAAPLSENAFLRGRLAQLLTPNIHGHFSLKNNDSHTREEKEQFVFERANTSRSTYPYLVSNRNFSLTDNKTIVTELEIGSEASGSYLLAGLDNTHTLSSNKRFRYSVRFTDGKIQVSYYKNSKSIINKTVATYQANQTWVARWDTSSLGVKLSIYNKSTGASTAIVHKLNSADLEGALGINSLYFKAIGNPRPDANGSVIKMKVSQLGELQTVERQTSTSDTGISLFDYKEGDGFHADNSGGVVFRHSDTAESNWPEMTSKNAFSLMEGRSFQTVISITGNTNESYLLAGLDNLEKLSSGNRFRYSLRLRDGEIAASYYNHSREVSNKSLGNYSAGDKLVVRWDMHQNGATLTVYNEELGAHTAKTHSIEVTDTLWYGSTYFKALGPAPSATSGQFKIENIHISDAFKLSHHKSVNVEGDQVIFTRDATSSSQWPSYQSLQGFSLSDNKVIETTFTIGDIAEDSYLLATLDNTLKNRFRYSLKLNSGELEVKYTEAGSARQAIPISRYLGSYNANDTLVARWITDKDGITLQVYKQSEIIGKTWSHRIEVTDEQWDGDVYFKALGNPRKGANGSVINMQKVTISDASRDDYFHYTTAGQLEYKTDPQGYVTQYYYDKAGNEIAQRRYKNTGLPGHIIESPHDRIHHTFYDGQGRVIGSLSADGALTTFTYNKDGQKQSQSTYHNQVRNHIIGMPLALPDGDKTTTRWTYNANGQVERELRADSSETHYHYDAMGQLVEVSKKDAKRGDISTERYQYDQQGRLVSSLDGNQNAELGADATQAQINSKAAQEGARTE
ncbi:hypothetical protein, partial [Pseudoalteromonas holothuriae]|uniref:hypothetical protein n=1 Tax=Pseudoalteromonas holothuriae TaxID=2963714 RepID=UPI0021C03EC9